MSKQSELVEAIMELNNEGDDWDAKHLGELVVDWHNKQVATELEALREEVKHEDLRTISQVITARIDKLTEANQ